MTIANRTPLIIGILLLSSGARAAATATSFTTAITGPGADAGLRIEQAIPRPGTRMAYTIAPDEQGRPVIQAYTFLLSYLAFSRAGGVYPWPALCEYQWGWNEFTRRLVPQCTSGMLREPGCALRGTVGITAFLSPRIDVRPEVTVAVESEWESVRVPTRVVLHDPRKVSWTGIPVILAELSTTVLEDGLHRLRIDGGFREFRIDGDPGTSRFEDGGDATVEFLVHNRPPRLVELAVFSASATVYRGTWRREPGPNRLILHRTGTDIATPASGDAVLRMTFSVPVAGLTVTAKRSGGGRITAMVQGEADDAPPSLVRRATIPWREMRPGAWTIRVEAETARGIPLEPLTGDMFPESTLGRLDPDSGRCQLCRHGMDDSHHMRIARPH